MDMPEIDTPAGTLRLVIAPGRPSVRLAVLEADGKLLFPATVVVTPAAPPDPAWIAQVAGRMSSLARKAAAVGAAGEVAPAFVAFIRELGDEAAWHFTNDDPDDMEEAATSVRRGLESALRQDDPYRATKAFERDVSFGQADIRMVDLFRSADVLGRVAALAGAGSATVAAAAEMERENLAKSQMVRAIALGLREEWDARRAPGPR